MAVSPGSVGQGARDDFAHIVAQVGFGGDPGDGFAGYSDWCLPTIEELRTLVYCSSGKPKTWNDTGKSCKGDYQRPTIASEVFPNTPTPTWW